MIRPSWSLLPLVSLLALPTLASAAEQVPLPYQFPDQNGNQWVVFFQGTPQQQGNQAFFSQAGAVAVNGQQPQLNEQHVGSFNAEARELTVQFDLRDGIRLVRRVKFQEESDLLRVIDVFENTLNRETTIKVQLTTGSAFGSNQAMVVADPTKRQGNAPVEVERKDDKSKGIAWVTNTGAERTLMSLLAGKGSRVTPTIQHQQNNSVCYAALPLKLGPRQKAAIAHWYGTFDSPESAVGWIEAFKEAPALSDLPAEVRRVIVNVRGGSGGGGFVGERELLRGTANTDIVEVRGGDQVRGTLKPEDYVLKTAYGTITLPASRVAGVLNVGEFRPRQLLVTPDGEIFGGELQQQAIPLQLASGQTTQLPLSQVTRIGFRSANTETPEWQFDQPMAFLTGGERCRIALPGVPVELVTRYGTVTLTDEQISTIILGSGGAQEIYLVDGSRLTGVVSRKSWPLKLLASSDAKPVEIASAAIDRLQFKAPKEGAGAGEATMTLAAGDIVSARIDQPIKLVTTFDTLTLAGAEIAAIARPDAGLPDVQVTMFDQSTFRGTIEDTTLPLQLKAGPKLDVPVAAIRDYQNPRPFPAKSIVDQANALITQLNADDWKQREQVEVQLTAMGPAVLGLLEEAAPKQSAEARERLNAIIKALKKDQPPQTSRLPAPPQVE